MSLVAWNPDCSHDVSDTPLSELVPGYYKELVDSGTAEFGPDGSSATKQYRVSWANHPRFVQDVLGYAFVDGSGVISRVIPEQHPDYPGFWASTASVKPSGAARFDSGDLKSKWPEAKVEVTFRPADYRVLSDDQVGEDLSREFRRFVSRKTHSKADYFQQAAGSLQWVTRSSNKQLGAVPGRVVPSQTVEYTWHYVPATGTDDEVFRCPTEDRIVSLLGRTNSVTFDTVYPPGTLLFVSAEAELIVPRFAPPALITTGYHWRITYVFEHRDQGTGIVGEHAGVNYLFDPSNNRWDLVTDTGASSGRRLYLPGPLHRLFDLQSWTPPSP